MRKFFFQIYVILILSIAPLKIAYCEVFIVAKINEEIITNIDLDFEKRYLISLNPNLKKLDQNRIILRYISVLGSQILLVCLLQQQY